MQKKRNAKVILTKLVESAIERKLKSLNEVTIDINGITMKGATASSASAMKNIIQNLLTFIDSKLPEELKIKKVSGEYWRRNGTKIPAYSHIKNLDIFVHYLEITLLLKNSTKLNLVVEYDYDSYYTWSFEVKNDNFHESGEGPGLGEGVKYNFLNSVIKEFISHEMDKK